MNYLFFRTDRIGDFLITLPIIKAIKENSVNSKVIVVTSPKNNTFVKSSTLVDEVFILKSNTFLDKIKLFFKIRKREYESIIVSDKKNRSIFLTLFLKAKKKIFNVSKKKQHKFLNLFFKDVFLDNDVLKDFTNRDLIKKNCSSLNIIFEEKNFNFFPIDYFKNDYKFSEFLDLEEDYILFHYDEKWELDNYIKSFKAQFYNVKSNQLKNFLRKLVIKNYEINSYHGTIETKIFQN